MAKKQKYIMMVLDLGYVIYLENSLSFYVNNHSNALVEDDQYNKDVLEEAAISAVNYTFYLAVVVPMDPVCVEQYINITPESYTRNVKRIAETIYEISIEYGISWRHVLDNFFLTQKHATDDMLSRMTKFDWAISERISTMEGKDNTSSLIDEAEKTHQIG